MESRKKKADEGQPDAKHAKGVGAETVTGVTEKAHVVLGKLPEWDPSALDQIDHMTCLFLGKRRTGKSYFLRWVMHRLRKRWPMGIIITETRFNGFWQQYFPQAFIHELYDPELIKDLMQRQAILRSMENDGTLPKEMHTDIFIIFDDVMGVDEQVLKYDPVLLELMTAGRHFRISTFFCLQDGARAFIR